MTSMIVKSGHGSLVSSIVSTSGIQQETRIKRWLRELDGAQVHLVYKFYSFKGRHIFCILCLHTMRTQSGSFCGLYSMLI